MPTQRRAPQSRPRTRSSSRCAPSPARPGHGCRRGMFATAVELLERRPRDRRGLRASRTSTAPSSCSASASAATSFRASRPRSRCSTRLSRSPSARTCRATGSAPTSITGAPAAIAGSATSRPLARTSSTRSSSPRASTTGARWRDAYFQASLVAERTGHWVLSRNYAERAKNLFQELDDERTWAACSTTSAASASCSGSRIRRSSS